LSEPSARIKVLLLIGNRLLCEALDRILRKRADILIAAQVTDRSNLAGLIAKSQCDIALIDAVSAAVLYRQPRTQLRDLNPRMQLLMVGMETDESAFLKAVREGVAGYLLNEASTLEVIAAIRAVSRGEAVCSPQLCRALFESVARRREFAPSFKQLGLRLTRRQQELVPMIAKGLTNKEIASYLNLSEQTVKNHIHRMLRKTGANDRSEVIEITSRAQELTN
jgi:two-component system, NarL family, nitrate/nitrite response regulator NarL